MEGIGSGLVGGRQSLEGIGSRLVGRTPEFESQWTLLLRSLENKNV